VTDLLSACERDSTCLLDQIRELVAHESPSVDKAALEACALVFVRHLEEAGARVERRQVGDTAAHIMATWPGDGKRVVLLGHFDTVWPCGQIREQPLEERDGRLFGPGVFDMKAGLAIGAAAMRIVTASVPKAARPAVTLVATSDEETGSATSRALIEQLARESAAVLVLEPALAGGGLKTSRKGVGEFEITATGVSSHAGVDPGAGASAVHEIARQVIAVQALADPARGLTVNVGVIEGGTRPNVVAERARAVVDVRISRLEDAARVETAFRRLAAHNPRVSLSVAGGVNRPPMERGPGVARLYALAQDVARGLGREVAEGGTGGGSDGNFSAALGVPTLDGLGAIGDGAHARHEHVVIRELAPRAALVAGLLARLGDNNNDGNW
jgi:glutamate carboxypeptidase